MAEKRFNPKAPTYRDLSQTRKEIEDEQLAMLEDEELARLEAEELAELEAEEAAELAAQKTPFEQNVLDPLTVASYNTLRGLPYGVGDRVDDALANTFSKAGFDTDAQHIDDLMSLLAEDNPRAAALGKVGGFVNSMVTDPTNLVGGAFLKGGKVLDRLRRIVLGAVSGAADTALREDTDSDDVLWGALLGGAIPAGIEGIQAFRGGKDAAGRAAFNAIRPNERLRGEYRKDKGAALGRTLLDQGVLDGADKGFTGWVNQNVLGGVLPPSRSTMLNRVGTPSGRARTQFTQNKQLSIKDIMDGKGAESFEDVVKSGTGRLGEIGDRIGRHGQDLDDVAIELGTPSPISLLRQKNRLSKWGEANIGNTSSSLKNSQYVKDLTSGLPDKYISPSEAARDITDLGNKINFSKAPIESEFAERMTRKEREFLQEQLDTWAERNAPDLASSYRQDRRTYGHLKDSQEALEKIVDKTPAWKNSDFTIPGITMLGSLAMAQKNPALMATGVGLSTLLGLQRSFGSQIDARLLNHDFNPVKMSQGAVGLWRHLDREDRRKRGED